MKLIEEQQKYLAWKLSGLKIDEGRLTGVMSEAHVDLNPHQVQAALFALQSPFSKGVILADEVGLGKTIEAGIVISQMWSEGKRAIIIVVPASLQKQWKAEMEEKFFIPTYILRGESTPDLTNKTHIYICSYNYAASHTKEIRLHNWDLTVIDEAHKLRNVYKSGQKQAKDIKDAFVDCKKLLLTATPLQNSIQELYGLVSVIDDKIFGDIKSFNAKYGYNLVDNQDKFLDLKQRLKPVIHRTLRRQVEDYIKYTKRIPMVMEYTPYPEERELYALLTKYLSREDTYGIPSAQRKLMLLVFRKVMASSTMAVAHTIKTVIERLQNYLDQIERQSTYSSFESELDDMFGGDADDILEENGFSESKRNLFTEHDIAPINSELSELKTIYEKAKSITKNKKGESLLKAVKTGFKKMEELGASQKALVFTENKTTQQYIKSILEGNGYKGKLVLFNGDNNDEESNQIYKDWLDRNLGNMDETDPEINRRQALVDYFRDSASIMIATEAAAEGINLQFCSLVINYDLPWNPQRIEQRIGRCHRYGQKHDVVVINFINKGNAADKRVYELLQNKFHLFDGVFGSSNEVLGAITSGTNIESKIANLYQNCRTEEEIKAAFTELQKEVEDVVEEEMSKTRRKLLESMNDDVLDLMQIYDESRKRISEYNQWLWDLTLSYLGNDARVKDANNYVFTLLRNPFMHGIQRKADYAFNCHNASMRNYRVGCDLAQSIIKAVKEMEIPHHNVYLEKFESPEANSGYLALEVIHYESSLHSDDKILLIAMDEHGNDLSEGFTEKLINSPMLSESSFCIPEEILKKEETLRQQKQAKLTKAENALLEQLSLSETTKIEKWQEDQLYLLDKAIDDALAKRQEAKRNRDKAMTEAERQKYQSMMEDCDIPIFKARQAKKKRTDKIAEEAAKMKATVAKRIKPAITSKKIFFIHWTIK